MGNLWFMLTLLLDVHPFVIAFYILFSKEFKKSFVKETLITCGIILVYDLGIYFTYTNGLYGPTLMVVLRALVMVPLWIVEFCQMPKYPLQIMYKVLICCAFMITGLKISAIYVGYIDVSGYPDFMVITLFRLLFYTVFLYPFCRLINRNFIPFFRMKNRKLWGSFILLQLLLNTAMILTLENDFATRGISLKEVGLQFVLSIGSVGGTLFIFTLFHMFIDMEMIKEKQKREELLLSLSEQQFNSLQNSIEVSRKIKHDIRHHLNTIRVLLDNQEYDKVEKYLDDYVERMPESPKISFCSRGSLNAILEYYYIMAKNENINININCAALGDCHVSDVDLNVILGNAIENAIEACRCIPEADRFIKVCSQNMAGQIFITIDNSFDGIIKMGEDFELSRKRQFSEQGYGLASIQAIADKYEGVMKKEISGNTFMLSIMLNE